MYNDKWTILCHPKLFYQVIFAPDALCDVWLSHPQSSTVILEPLVLRDPSASMQKRSAGDTELLHFSRGDALSKIDGKGVMPWITFPPSFKSWSPVIFKQHLCFPHRLPFLSPLLGQYWLFHRSPKQQYQASMFPPCQISRCRPWLPAQHWLFNQSQKQQH